MGTQSWEMLSIGWKVTVKIVLVLTQTSQPPTPTHNKLSLPALSPHYLVLLPPIKAPICGKQSR
jgi:hypothetical protein